MDHLSDAPIFKYCQKSLNIYCFRSLEAAFASINHNNDANAISLRIKESLKSEVGNCIDFEDNILKGGETEIKGKLRCVIA